MTYKKYIGLYIYINTEITRDRDKTILEILEMIGL